MIVQKVQRAEASQGKTVLKVNSGASLACLSP